MRSVDVSGRWSWRRLGRVAALLLAGVSPVPDGEAAEYQLMAEPLAEGVWVIPGLPGHFERANGGAILNVGILEADDGVILIDAGPSRVYGEALRALVARMVGKPVQRVFITHHHPDHVLGAQVFPPAQVCASEATRRELAAHGQAVLDELFRLLGDWMRGTRTFVPGCVLTEASLTLGGRPLELIRLGGHSGHEADLVVFDVRSRTLFAGDLVFSRRAPTTPHAHLADWRASLDVLAALKPARIVPGHGPMQPGMAALEDTRRWLDWLENRLRDAASQGLSMGEALALPVAPAFADWDRAQAEYIRSVNHLYPTFMAEMLRGSGGS